MVVSPGLRPGLRSCSFAIYYENVQRDETSRQRVGAYGGIAPNALLVQALVAQLRVTLQAITACDTAIAQRAQSHPDFPLFQALPGAGPVFAARLLVAFGEQRERYPSATALQK